MIPNSTAVPRLDLLGPIINDGFSALDFIAHLILPCLTVSKIAGAIPSSLFTDAQQINIVHAKGGRYARVMGQTDTKSYTCGENGLEEPLDIRDYDIMTPDKANMITGRRLTTIVLRQREIAVANTLMGAGGETTFAGQVTNAVAAWDTANGDPFTDVKNMKLAIWKRCGIRADTWAMSYTDYLKLCVNQKLQDKVRALYGYSGKAETSTELEIDTAILCKVFKFKRVLIGMASYDTAKEGQAQSFSDIWASGYNLVFKGADPGQEISAEPSLGRSFLYDQSFNIGELATGVSDEMLGLILEQYRDEGASADILRAREFIAPTLLMPKCAQLGKGN